MGGKPYCQFAPEQKQFERMQAVGYQDFMEANTEVDSCFVDLVLHMVKEKSVPCIIAIAGQTAAGKTEITERLTKRFEIEGRNVTTVEIDHFLLDRDYREANGIDSLGMEALHAELFKQCLQDLQIGKPVDIPHYDFITATSSHDLEGKRKPGGRTQTIQPADVIFMEGNFPFLYPEIASFIDIKVMYLTEDDIRLKRKWKRDIDYRKKYELYYHLNRYFREQFIMAEKVYKPQMALCDLIVDTTKATIWALPELKLDDLQRNESDYILSP
jgi:uridine kinase